MIEVVGEKAIAAARKAFDEHTPIQLFGVSFLVVSIRLDYMGRTLGGTPVNPRATVELSRLYPLSATPRPSAGDE